MSEESQTGNDAQVDMSRPHTLWDCYCKSDGCVASSNDKKFVQAFLEKDRREFEHLCDMAAQYKLQVREQHDEFEKFSRRLCGVWSSLCVRCGGNDGCDKPEHHVLLCSFVSVVGMLDEMFVPYTGDRFPALEILRIGDVMLLNEAFSATNRPMWVKYVSENGLTALYDELMSAAFTERHMVFFKTAHELLSHLSDTVRPQRTVLSGGDSILYRAVRLGLLDVVRKLCAEGHDPNSWIDVHPVHALAFALGVKFLDAVDIVRVLVRHGLVMTVPPAQNPAADMDPTVQAEVLVRVVYLFQVAFGERRALSVQKAIKRLNAMTPEETEHPPMFNVHHECHYERPVVSDTKGVSWDSKSLLDCEGVVVRPTIIVNDDMFPGQVQLSIMVSVNRAIVPTTLSLYVVPDARHVDVQRGLHQLHAVRMDFRMREYMSHIKGALEESQSNVPFFVGAKNMVSTAVDAQAARMAALTLRGLLRSRTADTQPVELSGRNKPDAQIDAHLCTDDYDKNQRMLLDANNYLETLNFRKGEFSVETCFVAHGSVHFDQVNLYASMKLEDYETPKMSEESQEAERPRTRLTPEHSMAIQTPVLTFNLTFTHQRLVDAARSLCEDPPVE